MVFNSEWFSNHQAILLTALNTKLIGHALRRALGLPMLRRVAWISENAVGMLEKNGQIKAKFYTDDHFAKLMHSKLYHMWSLFHQWDLKIANPFLPALNLGFDTLTDYTNSGGGSATATLDGEIVSSSNTDWATARAGTETVQVQLTSNTSIIVESTNAGASFQVSRGFITFKTGIIGTGSTITAAVIRLYGATKSFDNGAVHITQWNTLAPTSLAASDYTLAQTTSFASVGTPSTGSYNVFTLSATGRGTISKTYISAFCVMQDTDVSNTDPNLTIYWSFNSADNASNKPYLEVTYTPETLGQNYSVNYLTSGVYYWIAPVNTSTATATIRGAGGSGGTRSSTGAGGGGGGGAYSQGTANVVSNTFYAVTVGASGNNSHFVNASTVLAVPGGSVSSNNSAGASGGAAASCIGSVTFSGGNGANGVAGSYGGGGGEAAGSAANGNNGSGSSGGSGLADAGDGGAGAISQGNGTTPSGVGGGGGGALRTSSGTRSGGNGAVGSIVISYTPSAATTVFSHLFLAIAGF